MKKMENIPDCYGGGSCDVRYIGSVLGDGLYRQYVFPTISTSADYGVDLLRFSFSLPV